MSEIIINKSANELRIGDIGFARTKGIMGRLIRWGEWLKFRSCDFNHTFVVVSTGISYNDTWIVQAEIRGVKLRRLSEVLPGASEIHFVHPPKEADGLKVAEFALRQLGDPYGFITIFCIALDITTPDWFLEFRRNWSWICSALTAESLRYAGWLFDFGDIYMVTPTQLWKGSSMLTMEIQELTLRKGLRRGINRSRVSPLLYLRKRDDHERRLLRGRFS